MAPKWEKVLDRLLYWIGLPCAAIYVLSMFAYPLVVAKGDWAYLQNTWDRWQGLNVGVLAFGASIIAFKISRFKEAQQRNREFQAAKAFLPAALSELTGYLKGSGSVYKYLWNEGCERAPDSPVLPTYYKEIFANCIRHASPEVGNYLSQILANLQIHHSRMSSLREKIDDDCYIGPNKPYLLSCLCRLGELKAMVDHLYQFARGLEEFSSGYLNMESFRAAFSDMEIAYEDFYFDEKQDLEIHVRRFIDKSNS